MPVLLKKYKKNFLPILATINLAKEKHLSYTVKMLV